mgnify:CR=1 FL=1
MRIVIAGGSGLLGRALCTRLVADGHDIVVLSRGGDRRQTPRGGVRFVAWNADGTAGAWADEVEGADAVVNLSGAGIAASICSTVARRATMSGTALNPPGRNWSSWSSGACDSGSSLTELDMGTRSSTVDTDPRRGGR